MHSLPVRFSPVALCLLSARAGVTDGSAAGSCVWDVRMEVPGTHVRWKESEHFSSTHACFWEGRGMAAHAVRHVWGRLRGDGVLRVSGVRAWRTVVLL